MTLFATILFFVVFILLFVACVLYISITVQRLWQENRLHDKMHRGVHLTDMVALVTAIPDAVLIVNQSGVIVQANHHAIALLGQQVEILLPEQVQQKHREHRAHYFANPKVRRMGEGFDLAGVRSDGMQFPIEVSLSPLVVNGEQHAVAIIRAKEA